LKELKAAAKGDTRCRPTRIAAQVESWKRLYDWIRITEGRPLFGYIRNEDRFGLRQAATVPILFVEVDPASGKERFRARRRSSTNARAVLEFALANTFENEIQLRRREFGKTIGAGHVPGRALVRRRVLAPARRGAARARGRPRRCTSSPRRRRATTGAATGRLARCYEAQFQFEKAYAVYESLIAGEFAHHPEVHARMAEIRGAPAAVRERREALRGGRAPGPRRLERASGPTAASCSISAASTRRSSTCAPPTRPSPATSSRRRAPGIRIDLGRALVAAGTLPESARHVLRRRCSPIRATRARRAGLVACDLIEEEGVGRPGTGRTRPAVVRGDPRSRAGRPRRR
jgi:hypothetical protein